jgi:hypothetical protein
MSFRARLRYDADYGASAAEQDPTQFNAFIPGFRAGTGGAVDVMYGYVEGRRFLHGLLGFKVGRQYVVDVLGWWSFDGGEVSVTTPYYLKAEVYGGLEQRGGMPLSTPRFQADGIWVGSRSNFDPTLYPAFQPASVAPAYGVALESTGVTWIHGRLTYRRVYDTGSSNVTEFASGIYAPAVYDGPRISQDRLGYAVDANLPTVGGIKAGIVYDFYRGDVTSLYGSLDGYLGQKVTISADYDYYRPWYDGDSIFNFFLGEPSNDIALRANVDVTDKISVSGSGSLRIFEVQTGPINSFTTQSPLDTYPTNGHPFDEGANLAARYRTGEMLLTLRGAGNWGDEGDRAGADVAAVRIFETRYIGSARVGVWQWDDKLRPDRDATSLGYVLGAGYRFLGRSTATFEWEHDINSLVGQRLRLLFLLTLAVPK